MAEMEIGRRKVTGVLFYITGGIAIFTSLFHLYTAGVGLLSALDQRGIHLLLMLTLAFITYSTNGNSAQRLQWMDCLLMAGAIASSAHLLATWESNTGAFIPTLSDLVFGFILILVVLEAARRTSGLALPITAMVFLAYAFVGDQLPGLLSHKRYSMSRIVSFLYTTTEGIYGLPIGISSTFVVLYVIFGAFLSNTGAGKLFVDLAFAIAGKRRGGPAKVAVVSSALMGTITGSPLAEVATTGTITIPLMIEAGYRPHVAGAIEAVAATGGMIMPPVMAAVAFLIAENLGISYFAVAKAAALPAILYYACLYFMVDFEAAKMGLKGLAKEDLPTLLGSLIKGWYALIPLIALVIWISMGWSPMVAGFWSILLLLGTVLIGNRRVLNSKTLTRSLRQGAENAVSVASACACAGIILGVISVTGLGVKLTSFTISLRRKPFFRPFPLRRDFPDPGDGSACYSDLCDDGRHQCPGPGRDGGFSPGRSSLPLLFWMHQHHYSASGPDRLCGCSGRRGFPDENRMEGLCLWHLCLYHALHVHVCPFLIDGRGSFLDHSYLRNRPRGRFFSLSQHRRISVATKQPCRAFHPICGRGIPDRSGRMDRHPRSPDGWSGHFVAMVSA
jgi:TRAP-type uncharacterized transport system fused permease subunit